MKKMILFVFLIISTFAFTTYSKISNDDKAAKIIRGDSALHKNGNCCHQYCSEGKNQHFCGKRNCRDRLGRKKCCMPDTHLRKS